ncbi:MAG: hypothetical protein DI551_00760 [Micavibrio aeruginosavorus]|uniref:Uncharacterized protein n=1 Tax=Micavibrio aeruginosavorus TaxID=349221 RepID=A0A2W5N719_9BACT|nr:MAG: hypothetical protein DI551_00760 [Micavibrio aeruginosavorus]
MSGLEILSAIGLGTAGTTTAASAAGAMAGGWLTAGTTAGMTSASILGAVSNGLTLASAFSSLFGGMQDAQFIKDQGAQQAYALEMSAREDALDASQEALRGKQETNDMLDNLIQTVASQRLQAAAGGVDPNFGTPVSVNENARNLANRQMGVTRQDAQIRALARRRQSWARREDALNTTSAASQKASSAVLGGIAQAGGSVGTLISRRIARG